MGHDCKIGGVGVGFWEGGNTKAGGLFPRNGKDVVWKAETLEDMHGRFLLHEKGEWALCSAGGGCVHVRIMGSL